MVSILVMGHWTSSSVQCEGVWEFAQPVSMCFVVLVKALNRVAQSIQWSIQLS